MYCKLYKVIQRPEADSSVIPRARNYVEHRSKLLVVDYPHTTKPTQPRLDSNLKGLHRIRGTNAGNLLD
jgi:hypothetical protein